MHPPFTFGQAPCPPPSPEPSPPLPPMLPPYPPAPPTPPPCWASELALSKSSGDVDGDGDLDMVVRTVDGGWRYLENVGGVLVERVGASSPLQRLTQPPLATSLLNTSIGTLADLDGDGVNELIISDGAGVGGAHTLVYSQACSCFEPTTDSSAGTFTGTAGLGITSMSFADYDGDGDLDLLGGQEDGRLLYVCNMGTASAPSFAWPVLGDSRCYLNNHGAVECGQPSVLLESPPPPPFMPLPISTGDDLCYSVNLDGLVHIISPVTSLPHPHAAVRHNLCSPNLTAESSIPARTSCRLQSGFNGLSPHPTNVLNAGQLFYAYGYPNSSSSNIGYETDDAVSTYFLVTDHEAGSTSPSGAYFVFQVSKAGTSSGGNLNADFSFPAYPSSMNYPELVLLDDPGEGALNVWDRETGTGQFTWSWTGCCTGGMVLGPFPPMGFTMKIELGARGNSSDPRVFGGTTSVRVGSYSSLNNDVDFMTMPARPMEITVTGQTCNDYCAIATSCGECTIRSAGDTLCGWCSATGTCMPAARAAVVCPDHPTIGDAFIEYRTCCPACEALFGQPDACTETAGCGYCAETGECISGSSELACRLCTAASPFNISALVNDDPNATCVPPDAFVQLHMHNARIVRSNLGGQGGLCSRNASDCDEPYNNVTTPHNILIRNIGLNVMSGYHQPAGAISGGEVVDLLITNLTTYRSWAPNENGLVVKNGVNEFAQINLLAPRRAQQTNSWNTEMTFVELKFEFVTMNSTTGALRPLPLGRIFLTFHDFYTGRIRQGVISNTEIIQIDPVAAHPTELVSHADPPLCLCLCLSRAITRAYTRP